MEVTFPGNKRVLAEFGGFRVETDQSPAQGGDGSAPAPFDLFLASLATCAGVYMLSFMQQRGLSTERAGVTLDAERNPDTGMIEQITIELRLPPSFPEKYRSAVHRAVDLCAVKKHLQQPPAIQVSTTIQSVDVD
jgi:ribosomal protein S12 methylthiotransferase accessory factor